MLNVFTYLIFYFYIFLVGRAFYFLINKVFNKSKNSKDDEPIFNLPIRLFYPFLGLFGIGNVVFLLNFFTGVNNTIFNIFLFLLVVLFNYRNYEFFDNVKTFSINFILIPGFLAVSSLNIGFARDAGGYHLNFQNWLSNKPITSGLYLLNPQYGFTSILDYVNTIFSIGSSYIVLHYVNLVFISSILSICIFTLTENKNVNYKIFGLMIIIFGILDNFGFNGGKNGFIEIDSVPKQDSAFTIISIFLFVIFTFILTENNFIINKIEFTTICFLSFFAFQLRTLGFLYYLLLLYVFFKSQLHKDYKSYTKPIVGFLILNILWLIKNVLMTSCLIFPVKQLCFKSLPWSNIELVALSSNDLLRKWHGAYSFGSFTDWFNKWIHNQINLTFSINFLISLLLALLLLSFVSRFRFKFSKNYIILFIFIFLNFFFWITTAPAIRLGNSIFLNFALLMMLCINADLQFSNRFKSVSIIFLLMVSFSLPRFENYGQLLENSMFVNDLRVEKVSYIKNQDFGVSPVDGVSCWVNISCKNKGRNAKLINTTFFNYFIP